MFKDRQLIVGGKRFQIKDKEISAVEVEGCDQEVMSQEIKDGVQFWNPWFALTYKGRNNLVLRVATESMSLSPSFDQEDAFPGLEAEFDPKQPRLIFNNPTLRDVAISTYRHDGQPIMVANRLDEEGLMILTRDVDIRVKTADPEGEYTLFLQPVEIKRKDVDFMINELQIVDRTKR